MASRKAYSPSSSVIPDNGTSLAMVTSASCHPAPPISCARIPVIAIPIGLMLARGATHDGNSASGKYAPDVNVSAKARNPIAPEPRQGTPAEFAAALKEFALAHEADTLGMVPLDPLWVFDGYTIADTWVVVLAFAHNYDQLKQVPSSETNGAGVTDVGLQYARGTRASFALANWIRAQGYNAKAYPGPSAEALLLIPPAIASGLGELGKHGSIISRQFGAGVRLAGVTTTMPLVATAPDRFGADDFCLNCQICTNACPPGAISDRKQTVRGVERWYVDFDKCIPYFVEEASCGICIAVCPWTRPAVRPNLLAKMAKRLAQKEPATAV